MELNLIKESLESHFYGVFRKVWVQSNSKSKSDLLITLFDTDSYNIISLRNIKDLSLSNIISQIESKIVIK